MDFEPERAEGIQLALHSLSPRFGVLLVERVRDHGGGTIALHELQQALRMVPHPERGQVQTHAQPSCAAKPPTIVP